MPTVFSCPSCGARIEMADGGDAATGTCPACQDVIDLPGAAAKAGARQDWAKPEHDWAWVRLGLGIVSVGLLIELAIGVYRFYHQLTGMGEEPDSNVMLIQGVVLLTSLLIGQAFCCAA